MKGSVRREQFTVQWETRPTKHIPGGGFSTDFDAKPTVHTQDVVVEVDMAGLARILGTKACRSAGGRATEASGLVKITAVKGTKQSRVKP